jgi:hypothetical protein
VAAGSAVVQEVGEVAQELRGLRHAMVGPVVVVEVGQLPAAPCLLAAGGWVGWLAARVQLAGGVRGSAAVWREMMVRGPPLRMWGCPAATPAAMLRRMQWGEDAEASRSMGCRHQPAAAGLQTSTVCFSACVSGACGAQGTGRGR